MLCIPTNTKAITIISLGGDCQVAYYLRKYDLRQTAFPLDWLRSYTFMGVCKLIENNFENFLNERHLECRSYGIINKLYNIEFVHDFPIIGGPSCIADENEHCGAVVSNYLDYLKDVRIKFNTRIDRFIQVIQSTEFIYFIRTNITKREARKYVNLIKKKYPKCNFSLVVVHGDSISKKKWNVPYVQDFYAEEKIAALNHWWSDKEWIIVFKNLQFPINLKRLATELLMHSCIYHIGGQ